MQIGPKGAKMCGSANTNCCYNADKYLFRNGAIESCRCLPSCTSIEYSAYVTQSKYDFVGTYSKSKHQADFNFTK